MMKNKYSYMLLLLLATVGLTVSCSEFVISEYDQDDAAIYFIRESYGQGDSITQSFALEPEDVTIDTVYLDIRTMGGVSDMDRPFVIKQTNSDDEDAAVPGVHYVPFDDPQVKDYFVIPANKAGTKVPVILFRHPTSDDMVMRLELTVVENDYFRPGIDAWRNILITTTSKMARPTNWDSVWAAHFGEWGPVKMKFIFDVTGLSDWSTVPDYGAITYLKTLSRDALDAYNAAHPDEPLREANGALITFPS